MRWLLMTFEPGDEAMSGTGGGAGRGISHQTLAYLGNTFLINPLREWDKKS